MVRRQGQMEQTFWYSSTGKRYTKDHTIVCNNQQLSGVLSSAGIMTHCESLTITGKAGQTANTWQNGVLNTWANYVPNLKSLRLKPTSNAKTEYNDAGYFTLGHYNFNNIPASLKYIEIGSLQSDGLYFAYGGYFRNDLNTINIYNTNGLTIVLYRASYSSTGGFTRGPAENTTVIQYNWITGELLTAS